MDASHHMAASTISELDLSACHPSSIADKFNAVPGLKPSAGKSGRTFISHEFFKSQDFPLRLVPHFTSPPHLSSSLRQGYILPKLGDRLNYHQFRARALL